MTTLIVGASGMVGMALYKGLVKRHIDVIGTYYSREFDGAIFLDIRNRKQVFELLKTYKPSIVYLPAFQAGVDYCESHPEDSEMINVYGCMNVIDASKAIGAKVIFISSSYVFDGTKKSPYTETDNPNPLNEYGKQKLAVETYIKNSKLRGLIVRTVGVFGEELSSKNFVSQVISAVSTGKYLLVPNDQFLNPVGSFELSRTLFSIPNEVEGLINISGDSVISKYQFALDIVQTAGLESGHISPVNSEDFSTIRPKNGSLDCSLLNNKFELTTPNYMECLSRYIENG